MSYFSPYSFARTTINRAVAPPPGPGWDVSTAVFLQSFSISAQDTNPAGIFFKPDGLKMYMVGESNDRIFEYDLSIAWDITSAVFLQSFLTTGQSSNPIGLFIKPDGLQVFIVDAANENMFNYTLSIAWDITTASFTKSFLLSGQDGTPVGMFIRADGLKMYMVGLVNDRVYEYDLSIPWDIATAVFLQFFVIATEEGLPTGLFFKPDGLKMFTCGIQNDNVYEYQLSTSWDITTASFTQLFSFTPQDNISIDIFFRQPDGLKMYMSGRGTDRIFEYDL